MPCPSPLLLLWHFRGVLWLFHEIGTGAVRPRNDSRLSCVQFFARDRYSSSVIPSDMMVCAASVPT